MKKQPRKRLLLLIALLAIVPACGKKTPAVPEDLTPVEGLVTLDKKPLPGVAVTFCPEIEGSPSASGVTDANGRFRLTTFPSGNGARPGKYKVIVVAHASTGYSPHPTGVSPSAAKAIPASYGIPAQSPLTASVPVSGEIVFDLKSKS